MENYLAEQMLKMMPCGYALLDIIWNDAGDPVDYRFLDINPAFECMAGLKSEDIVGRTILDVFPTTEGRWIESYRKVALSGEPICFEFSLCEQGKYFEAEAFCPTPDKLICTFQDITQRKCAEQSLKERVKELNLLQSLLNSVQSGKSLEDVLQDVVDNMPNAWLYAKLACARIVYGGRLYQTANFGETAWRQATDIRVGSDSVGFVELFYLEERPLKDEGPFVKEERAMINMIAERLGSFIELLHAEKAAQEKESMFKDILEFTLSGFWDWNLVDNTEYLSPTFKKMFGYEDHEMENSPEAWQGIIFPEDLPGVLEVFDRHVQSRGKEPFYNEIRYRHKDGSTVWVICAGRVIEWAEDGTALRMVGCHVDITERKLADKALQESESRLRLILETIPAAVFLTTGANTRLEYLSAYFTELFGYSHDDVPTLDKWFELAYPDEVYRHSIIQERMDNFNKAGADSSYKTKMFSYVSCKDGAQKYILWYGVMLGDQLLECGFDLTNVREAEKSLLDSLKQNQRILDNMQDAYFQTDASGNFVLVNPAASQMFGYDYEETMGMSALSLYADADERNRLQEEIRSKGSVKDFVSKGLCKDGSEFWASVNAQIIENENGVFLGIEGLVRDISERKMMEMDLITAKERAEAASIAKSQFLANMSHEIRTPLNGVMGTLQLLEMTELDLEQQLLVTTSLKSSNALLQVLNDILEYSRTESGRLILESKEFSLHDLVHDIVSMFKLETEKKGLEFVTDIAPDPDAKLVGDSFRLKQILSNLVGNAIKFTHTGQVCVSIKHANSDNSDKILLEFQIRDTGIGIPSDRLTDIFASFCQVDASHTRRYGGSGLGLAICKGLIDQMNGQIWVESQEGIGTAFYFTVELDRAHNQEEAVEQDVLRDQQKHGRTDSLELLVVEDDEFSRKMIKILCSRRGWKTTFADNGAKAVECCKKNKFDLVFMDIQMPEMNGYRATTIIRQHELGSKIRTPIIAMTAHALDGDREKCLEAGMDDYLTKPLNVEAFYSKVEEWLK